MAITETKKNARTCPQYSFPPQENPIDFENKKKWICERFSHKFIKILDNLFFMVFHIPWQHNTFAYDTEQQEHYPSVSLYYYWEKSKITTHSYINIDPTFHHLPSPDHKTIKALIVI